MRRLQVRHLSTYRYAAPVTFGEHRAMVRPRDSHDLRLVSTNLTVAPAPSATRWLHDVFGNSVAVLSFDGVAPATDLTVESRIVLDHFEDERLGEAIELYARLYPFAYDASEVPDLTRSLERHHPDPEHAVDLWARKFVRTDGPTETESLLAEITHAIKDEFTYAARELEGTQAPDETLRLGSGSCRDFALFMMEAVRALGFAARFVTGYLFVPNADGAGTIGGGATHAWVQVHLPGAGWVEFDPTNGIVGNRDLIRVAVTRTPAQAVPLAGSWTGKPADFLGLTVEVTVTDLAPGAAAPAGPGGTVKAAA